jgi:hypothetical protein
MLNKRRGDPKSQLSFVPKIEISLSRECGVVEEVYVVRVVRRRGSIYVLLSSATIPLQAFGLDQILSIKT